MNRLNLQEVCERFWNASKNYDFYSEVVKLSNWREILKLNELQKYYFVFISLEICLQMYMLLSGRTALQIPCIDYWIINTSYIVTNSNVISLLILITYLHVFLLWYSLYYDGERLVAFRVYAKYQFLNDWLFVSLNVNLANKFKVIANRWKCVHKAFRYVAIFAIVSVLSFSRIFVDQILKFFGSISVSVIISMVTQWSIQTVNVLFLQDNLFHASTVFYQALSTFLVLFRRLKYLFRQNRLQYRLKTQKKIRRFLRIWNRFEDILTDFFKVHTFLSSGFFSHLFVFGIANAYILMRLLNSDYLLDVAYIICLSVCFFDIFCVSLVHFQLTKFPTLIHSPTGNLFQLIASGAGSCPHKRKFSQAVYMLHHENRKFGLTYGRFGSINLINFLLFWRLYSKILIKLINMQRYQ